MSFIGKKPADTIQSAQMLADGTVTTAKIQDNAVTSAKIPSAAITQAKMAAGVAGNGPAFSAYKNGGNQAFSANTSTKVTFESESFDTASCYDTSTSRFTPNVAGYYMITANIETLSVAANYLVAQLKKNGSVWFIGSNFPTSASAGPNSSLAALVYLNGSTDYVEIYVQASANATVTSQTESIACKFQGFLARSAT